jgi:molybdate transport system ATP-binding protein
LGFAGIGRNLYSKAIHLFDAFQNRKIHLSIILTNPNSAGMPSHLTPALPPLFLELKDVTFSRYRAPLFQHINWQIREGESWAITGPVGAGKSTFAEALTGKFPLLQGQIHYHFNQGEDLSAFQAHQQIALIAFNPKSSQLNYGRYYYQQRFNSSDADGLMTVWELLARAAPAQDPLDKLERVTATLGIGDLLPLEIIKLSNGQTRKMLIAQALLQEPRLLILDNPYTGLDVKSRQDLSQTLADLVATGTRVMLITNQTDIPATITHVLEIRDFQVRGVYARQEYLAAQMAELATDTLPAPVDPASLFPPADRLPEFEIAVRLQDTTVRYDQKKVLDGINWMVKAGEKWALSGPNGSGKTTLLSLINGDNPQAFANKITLFDRRKGSGESIWDIKKKIGFVSPELHLYFRHNMRAESVAGTGFLDTLYLSRPLSPAEQNRLEAFFSYFGLEQVRQKSFLHLSSGEQRLVLLIRSLVKNPDLLIWDEPFQGLNPHHIRLSLRLLQAYATPAKTLILVTHHAEEIPQWVGQHLKLENGRVS